jgi:hypothetical protein
MDAMAENGINDATVGVRGSSVTGFGGNPRSPTFGQPFGLSSDIDLFVESSDVVSAFKNQPNFVHPRPREPRTLPRSMSPPEKSRIPPL